MSLIIEIAIISCAFQLLSVNGNRIGFGIETRSAIGIRADSTAVCNTAVLHQCSLDFFKYFNYTAMPPSAEDFFTKFDSFETENRLTSLKPTCDWFKTYRACASPDACWTLENLHTLGFNNSGQLFFLLWEVDYLCTTAFDVIQANMDCLLSNKTEEQVAASNCTKANTHDRIKFCTNLASTLKCISNAYTTACNYEASHAICMATAVVEKKLLPEQCDAIIDDACTSPPEASTTPSSASWIQFVNFSLITVAAMCAAFSHSFY